MSDNSQPTRYRAGRRFRLTRAQEIDRVFDGGNRAADARLTLLASPNELDRSRLAVGAGKRHGGAVQRNRVKRLCREAFRLVRADLPTGWDFVAIPRPGARTSLAQIQESLRALAKRACGQARPRASGADSAGGAGGQGTGPEGPGETESRP